MNTQQPRRKTLSHHSPPHPPPKLHRHYSSLAQQSIHKDYHLAALQPFSSDPQLTQIESELQDLKIVVPQKSRICQGEKTIRQKMATIISTSRVKDYKNKKHRLVKSLFHNDQKAFIEDYKQELKTDKKIKNQIINNINRKLIRQYPSSIDRQSKKGTILSFKKEQKVTQLYLPEEEDQLRRVDTEPQVESRKSRKKRTLKIGLQEKYKSAKVIPKSGKYSKVYYRSYLCSYKGRKSLLNYIMG